MTDSTSILPGTVQSAPSGVTGFDCSCKLTSSNAQDLKAAGYNFCIRYVSHTSSAESRDIDFSEATEILNAGLALMLVQHPPNPGWSPTGDLGTTYGQYAAQYASDAGLPQNVNLWCDLEGVSSESSSQNIIDFCNNWYDAVSNAGYIPGLYVGVPCGLNSNQLYSDLKFQHYWRSLSSSTPDVDTRGYQMNQQATTTVSGVSLDPDITVTDNLEGQVQWLHPTNY